MVSMNELQGERVLELNRDVRMVGTHGVSFTVIAIAKVMEAENMSQKSKFLLGHGIKIGKLKTRMEQ